MKLAAALIYWAIVALWLAVLATVAVAYLRNPRTFSTARLLLAVVAIDTTRNIIENLYFGLYFGAQYGFFPGAIVGVLGNPTLLIIPKVINVVAGCGVFGILLLRWLPNTLRERARLDEEVRQTSEALKHESDERRRLFETSLDLILITDRKGNFLRVSPSCTAILGYAPGEMIGHNGIEFVHPGDLESTRAEMRMARSGQHASNFETRYIHKDGHAVTLAWSGVWSEPEQRHFFFGRDMTERKLAEEKLKYLAHYDQLTGLPNRVSLQADLGGFIRSGEGSSGDATSIALFDLDGFKDVNDTLGHSIGDRLLQGVAKRLAEAAGEAARLYRLGGDEFVMVMPRCGDPRIVAQVVERMLGALGAFFEVNDHRLFVRVSAGIAIAPADGSNVDELISNADLALYDAKACGGHAHRLFLPVLRAKANARRQLDAELRRAFADGEFELHFQPQVRLSNGRVTGAEALLRWKHPERGLLGAGIFIDALAESAIAPEVGRWVLQQACACAAGWQGAGLAPVRIGVNLFPVQFREAALLSDVEIALLQSGLPASALELEITENVALGHDERVLETLRSLRSRGLELAFDDFGTGYASLSYLTRYPLTRIKIDQSFVRKICEGSTLEDTAIVRSLIVMAKNLGLKVIAEGVETPAQAAFLRAQGCDEAQGYLYAKPLSATAFESFLSKNREMEKAAPSLAHRVRR